MLEAIRRRSRAVPGFINLFNLVRYKGLQDSVCYDEFSGVTGGSMQTRLLTLRDVLSITALSRSSV